MKEIKTKNSQEKLLLFNKIEKIRNSDIIKVYDYFDENDNIFILLEDDKEKIYKFNRFLYDEEEKIIKEISLKNHGIPIQKTEIKKQADEILEAVKAKDVTKVGTLQQEVTDLNKQIEKIRVDSEAEKEALKVSLNNQFLEEKAQLASDYVGLYDHILGSVKAQAVVMSAHDKESIRIYVVPDHRSHITEAGVGAEIKATKSVKGVIKPISGEPGFYRFESALDKSGKPVDFDFSLIAAGQIVKVSAK